MILTTILAVTSALAASTTAVVTSIPVVGTAIAAGTATLGTGVGAAATTALAAKGIADAVVIGSIAGTSVTAGTNAIVIKVTTDMINDKVLEC